MARKVEIQIVGDDRSLKRALGSAEHGAGRIGGAFRTAAAAAAGFAAVLGAEKIVEFGKDAVQSAADVQKSEENIRAQFGKSSEEVIQFGEHAATAFGISLKASLGFSSQMGIVAKGLGLSHDKAVEMDVGLQKLAGSIGMIKGQDPSAIFDKLSLAIQGNTRGLKALGITVTPVNEKLEAMRLGFIGPKGTISSLTGAQKAAVIYGIATQHLGQFTAEAQAHSGDFANQIIILKARLSNFADAVGAKILPVVSDLVGGLSKIINAPNINAKVAVVVTGISKAAGDIAAGIQHAFEGSSKTIKIEAPSGLVIGEKQDFSKGIVQRISDGLANADWSKIGHQVGAGIGGAITFSENTAAKLVGELVSGVNANRGAIAKAGLLIGVEMFTNLTDPSFWISNWRVTVPAILSGVLLALGPESRLAVFLKDLPFLGLMFKALEAIGKPLVAAGKFIGRELLAGLVEEFPALARGAERLNLSVIERIRSLPGRLGDLGRKAGVFIAREIAHAVGEVARAAADVARAIVRPFEGVAGRVAGPVLRAGRTVVRAVGGFVGQVFAKGEALGRAIMQGIAQGLSDLVGWLEGKISGIAGGLLDKAKGILHINSPSKVFADEVGKGIMEGIALGITKNAHLPHGAMAGVLPPGAYGVGGRGQSSMGGGRGEVIQVVLDGRILGEVLRERDKRYRRQNGGRELFSGR